jgi:hypothetical protein
MVVTTRSIHLFILVLYMLSTSIGLHTYALKTRAVVHLSYSSLHTVEQFLSAWGKQ